VPDPIVAADALPAGSSPAADHASVDAPDPLDALSASELQTWRETGDTPSTSPVTDADAASSPAEPVVQAASTDASPVAASEPAVPAKGAEARIPELLADRAREKEGRERAERRIRELEARPQPLPDARPAASSPAPAGLVKPDAESFAYGTADPAYIEALTDYKVAVNNATQRSAWEEGQRQARARDESARVMAGFDERRVAAIAKHPDFDAVAMLAPTEIPQGSALDLFILEDPSGAEVLYHLQLPANAAERTRISRLAPLDQIKEAVRLGDRLTATAPATRSTSAPPPPPTLSTRATPADAVERAWAMGDSDDATAAIIAAENARDLARLKR
jgi:hypothetical protein